MTWEARYERSMGQARGVLQECRDTNHKLYGKPLKDFDLCPLCTALHTALTAADSWKNTADQYAEMLRNKQ